MPQLNQGFNLLMKSVKMGLTATDPGVSALNELMHSMMSWLRQNIRVYHGSKSFPYSSCDFHSFSEKTKALTEPIIRDADQGFKHLSRRSQTTL